MSAKFGATANQSDSDDPQVGPRDLGRVQRPRPGRRIRPAGSKVAIFVCVKQANQTEKQKEELLTYTCQGIKLLMADVEVIGVGTTTLLSTTTTDETGAQTTEEIPKTILTLALSQEDAEKVILAKRTATSPSA